MVGASPFVNLMNTFGPGGKIPMWNLENARGYRMRETRVVTEMGKNKMKIKESLSFGD